jgi:penicillin-binding protein 1A
VVIAVHAAAAADKGKHGKNASPAELVVDLGSWRASVPLGFGDDVRYNPKKLAPDKRFAPGDVVRVVVPGKNDVLPETDPKHSKRWARWPIGAQGAVVAIDPTDRHVLAVVGGYRTRVGDFNRATRAKRQPGSSFKPFVYAAALDTGDFSPATIVDDAPEVYNLWKPENYKKGKFEGPVRLRYALAKSINTVAIKVANDVGPERIAGLARDMGIHSKLPTTLSLALGSGEATPLEMTNAFATIAARGKYAEPVFITKVGKKRIDPKPSKSVLRPEVAYVLANMMRSVVDYGTARRARKLKARVVGKTGTSNDARDAWFVGMSSGLVIGVWIGYDDNHSLGHHEGGGRTAVPVFVNLFSKVGRGKRARFWTMPANVEKARVDRKTGKLAPPGATAGTYYDEVFVQGTVPTETAPAPGQVDAAGFVVDQYDDDEDKPAPGASATEGQ